jgi:diguanylate cyclase (GGDEF)-like protein
MIYLSILIFTFIAIVADFAYFFLEGIPGKTVRILSYIDLIIYYMFQVAVYYCLLIFIDYITFRNTERTKKVVTAAAIIQAVHLGMLIYTIFSGFYFSLSPDNRFVYGNQFFFRIAISYLPIVFALADAISAIKTTKKSQVSLFFFFFALTSFGSIMDIVLGFSRLIWPCLSSALLYFYFFIVKNDSKIDSLTGIGNRYSFNEFIDKLSRLNTRQSYSVVMIDMDHFKEINDTLGHPMGDNALRDMASIIKGCIRHSDFAARYGGDEFVIAVKTEYDIEAIIGRIQTAIALQNEKNERPYKIQISYGYDVYTPKSGQLIGDFISHIDSLMYKHKRRRKTDILTINSETTASGVAGDVFAENRTGA